MSEMELLINCLDYETQLGVTGAAELADEARPGGEWVEISTTAGEQQDGL